MYNFVTRQHFLSYSGALALVYSAITTSTRGCVAQAYESDIMASSKTRSIQLRAGYFFLLR